MQDALLIHPKLQNEVHHTPKTTSQAWRPPSGASPWYAGAGGAASSRSVPSRDDPFSRSSLFESGTWGWRVMPVMVELADESTCSCLNMVGSRRRWIYVMSGGSGDGKCGL